MMILFLGNQAIPKGNLKEKSIKAQEGGGGPRKLALLDGKNCI